MIMNSYMLPETNAVAKYGMLVGPLWLGFVVVSRTLDIRTKD